jgi:hypothetical protein
MRRAAIVSPYFPPSTLAGVHRARLLARHLPAFGWEPVVFCVHERLHEETLDPGLASLVPVDTRLVKCGAWSSRWLRPLGIGDLSLRGFFPIRRALYGFLEREGADALLITTGPYFTALLGPEAKGRFGVPFVLDFQDPWVSRWGASLPRWSKGGLSHRLATLLEPRAVRAADHIVSVSDGANAELRERYPRVRGDDMSAIPIGGDPADFDWLRHQPPANQTVKLEEGAVNLCYVGTFLPRAGPVVDALFSAAAALRHRRPDLAGRLRLVFVGTSNQPDGACDSGVRDRAEIAGVGDLVQETPQRVSYLEALSLLARADGILLLGSDEPHYTASKIYPAILSGRPTLGIFHAASSACRVLRECGGAIVIDFSDLDGLARRTGDIAHGLETLIEAPERLPPRSPEAFEPYTARHVAGELAAIFDRVCDLAGNARRTARSARR